MTSARGLDARLRVVLGTFELDIEMTIPPGTTAALLGPNGSGKSTTVDLLSGARALDDRTGARIALDGRVLDEPATHSFVAPHERRIGVVFQDHLLFDHMSVVDNVAFSLRSTGATKAASRTKALAWLERIGLAQFAPNRPPELSGGQAQRVAIARALAAEPDLLLLDEPLAALDVASRVGTRRMLREHLGSNPAPRLLITHDPVDAFLLADTIHVIEQGRITQVGHPDAIRRHPATPYVAALAETNLFTGLAADGVITLDLHDHRFTIADTTLDGPVTATIPPRAVSLHIERPEGSQRNIWRSTVDLVEPLGDVTRVTLGSPVPIAVDVTPGAVAALALVEGSTVWAAVKATEVTTSPA